MGDLIPHPIYITIKIWLEKASLDKKPCQVILHINGEGQIVYADRVVKDQVAAG